MVYWQFYKGAVGFNVNTQNVVLRYGRHYKLPLHN
jgi:hypothetical protein